MTADSAMDLFTGAVDLATVRPPHPVTAASEEAPPRVVLAYGLGSDSSAILARWLTDPSSRDFSLDDLAVITGMTGHVLSPV